MEKIASYLYVITSYLYVIASVSEAIPCPCPTPLRLLRHFTPRNDSEECIGIAMLLALFAMTDGKDCELPLCHCER
jgi:hypothetical protein